MQESFTRENTSDDESSLFSISKEELLYRQSSQENLTPFDSFINFPYKNDDELSLEEIEKKDQRYFVYKSQKAENKIESEMNSHFGPNNFSGSSNILINKFKVARMHADDSGKKYAGRKRKNPITCDGAEKIHDRSAKDNVTRKIQVCTMNSIQQFVNEIVSIPDLGLEDIPEFKKIDYSAKKVVNKKIFEENKKKTIGNLMEEGVSPKYKTFSSDSNKKEYEKIKNNEIIKSILSMTYINYFKDVFYQNKRTIDLSKYGLKKTINLSDKVKLYEDMFKGKNEDEKYINRVEEIIRKKFLI